MKCLTQPDQFGHVIQDSFADHPVTSRPLTLIVIAADALACVTIWSPFSSHCPQASGQE
jgi:hypothetical protein